MFLHTLEKRWFPIHLRCLLFLSCRFSLGVVPKSGDTCQTGFSLFKDLSSVGFGGWKAVFDVNSSVTLSCWRAGVWGVEGASRGDVSTRISLVWSPGIQSSMGGAVCISHWFNPCLFPFNLYSGTQNCQH